VVGLQWGDEAKGKIVDYLTHQHDIVVRYNGGANAGHTVVTQGRSFKLSLLPSGILHPTILSVIGNGVVVYPPRLFEELDNLAQAGIQGNLRISDRAHVIFPYHMEEETLSEQMVGQAIGTTRRGIGPCYQDKAGRVCAIRIGELLDREHLRSRLTEIVARKNVLLRALSTSAKTFEANTLTEEYAAYGERLRSMVTDTVPLLHQSYRRGQSILFEAAQGTLLDIDHGSFPYVTSSNSSTTGVWNGSGFPARYLTKVIGVIKAYTTRVGGGPFPTELNDAIGERIRRVGKEFGTVTGRPRRCGWFDAVAVRYSAALAGADQLSLMLLDVLSDLDEVAICTSYEMDGNRTNQFPSDLRQLARCTAVYERLPGWKGPISNIRKRADLPTNARRYVDRLTELLELPISIISVGPDREQTIMA
jgi:adenylosuccinate synthase